MSSKKMHAIHEVSTICSTNYKLSYGSCYNTPVQEHMNSLNNMLEAFDGVYYVKHTYDMGRSFRGYSARMDEM